MTIHLIIVRQGVSGHLLWTHERPEDEDRDNPCWRVCAETETLFAHMREQEQMSSRTQIHERETARGKKGTEGERGRAGGD